MLSKPAGGIFTFYDIDLLLMQAPDWTDAQAEKAKEELGKLASVQDPETLDTVEGDPSKATKCCITNSKDPSKSYDQYMYGYARVVTFTW